MQIFLLDYITGPVIKWQKLLLCKGPTDILIRLTLTLEEENGSSHPIIVYFVNPRQCARPTLSVTSVAINTLRTYRANRSRFAPIWIWLQVKVKSKIECLVLTIKRMFWKWPPTGIWQRSRMPLKMCYVCIFPTSSTMRYPLRWGTQERLVNPVHILYFYSFLCYVSS